MDLCISDWSSVWCPADLGENPTHARMPAWRAALALVLLAIATTAAMAPADDVRLRIEGDAGSYLAWADNTLSGPVEVMLHSDSTGVRGEPTYGAACVRKNQLKSGDLDNADRKSTRLNSSH